MSTSAVYRPRGGVNRLLGWAESQLPLRLAFDRRRSSDAITAADSVAFWSVAERMERDLGMRLFMPAEVGVDTSGAGLVSVEIGAQPGSDGHTFVSWTAPGDANDGVVLFRRASTLRDSHVVTHELLHLIGFGHATGWPTVSLASGLEISGTSSVDQNPGDERAACLWVVVISVAG